jgi:hypothetical protein
VEIPDEQLKDPELQSANQRRNYNSLSELRSSAIPFTLAPPPEETSFGSFCWSGLELRFQQGSGLGVLSHGTPGGYLVPYCVACTSYSPSEWQRKLAGTDSKFQPERYALELKLCGDHERVIQHCIFGASSRDVASRYELLNIAARYNSLYPGGHGVYSCQFVILDTLDPIYSAAGIRTYPMQSTERYQVFVEHMVPDATSAICGQEGGLRPGEQRRVPYDANAACNHAPEVNGCSAIILPVGNRHAGWGEHEQRHCTAARQDYMESRQVFLEALIEAATEELRRNVEEGNRLDSTFEMYIEASEEPSPDLDCTLSTATPSTLAHTPGPVVGPPVGKATPNHIAFTPRKRGPTAELTRPSPYSGCPSLCDEDHDNYAQCVNCEGFHSDDEPCGV